MRALYKSFVFLTVLALAAIMAGQALAAREGLGVPENLAAWEGWVLHGQEEALCPPLGNGGRAKVCLFPSKLTLNLDAKGASFSLQIHAYARTAAALPVAKDSWPEDVTLSGAPAPVVGRGGVPVVYLEAGEHHLAGRLRFASRPEYLRIAPDTGLLEMTLDGKPVSDPDLAPDGRLRLAQSAKEAAPEDRLEATIFRLFKDDIPAVVTTLVRLEVSGMARRISLKNLLPEGSEPLAARSPLPIAFGPEGTLNVQAGPGGYDIEVDSRLSGPVASIGPMVCPFGPEIWSFDARRNLREVEIQGVPGVDPGTTDLPQSWKGYPAYLVEPGATMAFKVMHRGEAGAAMDELAVFRELWLDFDGQGLSVRDSITGEMRSGWTMSMLPPGKPERATIEGEDQAIVLLGEQESPGVEIRRSRLDLTAESRYDAFGGTFPAVGWDKDFQVAGARLHLPPGWRLVAAAGPDAADGAWMDRWNLLNIFLTLVISLAAFKLCGPWAGAAVLLFLGLSYHEAGAPVEAWIFLLVSLALVRIVRDAVKMERGAFIRRLIMGLYALSVLALALTSISFVFTQLRYAVYPQLEPTPYNEGMGGGALRAKGAVMPAPQQEAFQVMDQTNVSDMLAGAPETMSEEAPPAPDASPPRKSARRQILKNDPNALVQTGPGMPDWNWRSAGLSWNGPVAREQSVRLYLLSPGMNLVLACLRVFLLLAALFFTADLRRLKGLGAELASPRASGGADASGAALLIALALSVSGPAMAADYPPSELLGQLRERLLEPAPCFPDCLAVPATSLRIDGDALTIVLVVDTAAEAVVPLPIVSDRWQPAGVVLEDGEPARLSRSGGGLVLSLPQGRRRVVISGPVPQADSFDVSFPLLPKRAEVNAPGWTVQGLGEDGNLGGALRFARTESGGAALPRETYRIAPFLLVSRTLELGLTWEVRTEAVRMTPAGEPVVLDIPLLPGESVVTEGVKTADGKVRLNLKPGQRSISWRSRLDVASEIRLVAPKDVPWVEKWVLSASPIWSVAVSGVPAVRLLDEEGLWRPEWRPWPGEEEVISVTRPLAAPGPSLTINRVQRVLVQGERLCDETLNIQYRASKGGRQTVVLPAGAEVQNVTADGGAVPWSGAGEGEIAFPVSPGAHAVDIRWRTKREAGISTVAAPVDLKYPAANVDTRLQLPGDRWILSVHGDTPLGPAVLFWSYLAAIIIVAAGLGYAPFTPLAGWQWALLGLGLTQVDAETVFLAVAWILVLGIRRNNPVMGGWFAFDFLQIVLVLLTLAGLSSLYEAIQTGLLGLPRMQVAGNGSSAFDLVWTMDRIKGAMPEPGVVSVPLYVYRAVMLAWSLWLAWSLLGWLKWGYAGFSAGGVWRKPVFTPRKPRLRFREAQKTGPANDKGAAEQAGKGEDGPAEPERKP